MHQQDNVAQFVHSLGLNDAKPQFTPMDPRIDLNGEDNQPPGKPCGYREKKHYQSLTGQAIWLLRTRYDACYAINARCKKMAAPDKEDLVLMKRLGRFLKGTPTVGLIFNPSPKKGSTRHSLMLTAAYESKLLQVLLASLESRTSRITSIKTLRWWSTLKQSGLE